MAPIPKRVVQRPSVDMWSPTEVMTLQEAAALMWPEGSPITASTLRTAYRSGRLEVVKVTRKILVTREALEAMMEASRHKAGT
ncbi:helix-turn-helix domain-containing protein [Bradyrhizobium sp. USDA 329]|uniref:helix-turn-helix domain-containing protein n=1 Tax=unclassified Bradyrhizobium TaxID=2631580 RepID=UPI003514CD7C